MKGWMRRMQVSVALAAAVFSLALAWAGGARLDRRPVLEAEFAAFRKGGPPPGAARRGPPAVLMDWHQARAYCAAQGKRLPTAQEWLEACRARQLEFQGAIWEWTSTETDRAGEDEKVRFKLLCGPGPECACTHAYHPDWKNEVKGFRCARPEPSVRLGAPSVRVP